MKKIYILTAVLALLTLSLNAQTMATKKVGQAQQAAPTEKVVSFPISYQAALPNTTSNPWKAPLRATETHTVTFLPEYSSSTVRTKTVDGVTLTITQGDLGYSDAMRLQGTVTLSTAEGTITNIVFTGSSTSYPVTRLSTSTGSYTTSNNVGTWTGSASSVSFTASSQVRCTSIVVTVETETGDIQDLTVCNGQYYADGLPVYGYFYDEPEHNQMVYPASLLGTAMIGKPIKSMTFYPTTGWFDEDDDGVQDSGEIYSGINFYGGSVTFKLMNLSSGTSAFADQNPTLITGTMTQVATVTPARNTSATTWKITFDQDFTYTGGDLLIDVTSTAGSYSPSFFAVDAVSPNHGAYNVSYNGNYYNYGADFLPKVTFSYDNSQLIHDLGITLTAPEKVGAGNTATLTATVTNNGGYDETGYTVTFSDGTNTFSTQTGGTLAIGASETFTATYTTTAAQGGTTVNFTATVNCTTDEIAANNEAAASTSVVTLPPPENVVAIPGENQTATVTWDPPIINPVPITILWDFEEATDLAEFTTIDADGDGYNWSWHYNTGSGNYTVHTGSGVAYSESFDNDAALALSPDDWMISPEITLGGTLKFWAAHQASYPENFAVYVCQGPYSGTSSFTKVYGDITTTSTMTEHTVDLSQYSGQGYFAIRHYDVSDQFILLIDDITYPGLAPGEQPSSYNVYLDGVLVGNVDANDPRTYDFSNLTDGQHECAISAVYSAGESALVPAIFNTVPKTDPPVLTADTTATAVIITATGNGTVNLTVGNQTASGNGTASITVLRTDVDQNVTATATAQETGKDESDPATEQFGVPALPKTSTPVITGEVVGNNYVITATATAPDTDAEVTLTIGNQTVTGTGSVTITIPMTDVTQTVNATATALATDKRTSDEATETFTVPFLQTAAPVISVSEPDANGNVVVTATGDGTVYLTTSDGQTASGNGSASITLNQQAHDYTVTASAYAQESGKAASVTVTDEVTVPGFFDDSWKLMTGTYSGHQALSFVDSLTNKPIMFADSISAMTFDNRHPDHYDYVIVEEGHDKTSNIESIPVQKTYSTMYGLYTKSEVDGDTHRTLTANKANVSMSYDIKVDELKHMYNYSLYRSKVNSPFDPIDAQTQPISKLVYNPSANTFNEAQSYDVLPTINNAGPSVVKRVDRYFTDAVGEPLDYENYVPVIWTMGTSTGRTDGKNNSYGSDIKRNTLGDVDISIYVEKSNYTTTVNGETVQPGVWQYQGQDYTVFTPVITITGTPPAKYVANDGDTIVYEPYMFRAWCLYEHPHDFVRNSSTQLLEDNGEITDQPLLLGTVVTDKDTCTIGGLWDYGMDRLPWAFGAPVSTQPEDLVFAVRFYYRAIVKDSGRPLFRSTNRDGEEEIEEYLIVETSDDPDNIPTGINEIFNGGRVPVSTTYVNAVGMQSDKPFDGMNIIVTRYSDGTTSTVKVMR